MLAQNLLSTNPITWHIMVLHNCLQIGSFTTRPSLYPDFICPSVQANTSSTDEATDSVAGDAAAGPGADTPSATSPPQVLLPLNDKCHNLSYGNGTQVLVCIIMSCVGLLALFL